MRAVARRDADADQLLEEQVMGVEGLELAVVAHRTRHTHCEEEGETEGCSHIGLCSLSCSLSLSLSLLL